jgi:hypothetical protein
MSKRHWLWYILAGAALAGTFAAYAQFDLLINWVNVTLC